MKTSAGKDADPSLRAVLREWEVTTLLPPRFEEGVWRRIARHEQHRPAYATLCDQFQSCLVWMIHRPALAVAYCSFTLLAGTLGGYLHARSAYSDAETGWKARYVQTVDPWLAPDKS